ncbi:MAG: glycosyltransferase family 2 protein [Selenomonadaceae bacterium]|nr:glycosyltransferase family 2 protein [Selenomonadaceae bacterium]
MKKKKSSQKSKIDITSKLKISACYMVKNESKNLPRSIDSLKTQVDEIIVVDTGSTDNTIEIAKNYGAKVIETEWQNDFSTPRNLAIDNATGDWIIFLDADEFFVSPKKVRRAVENLSDNETILIPRINIDEENGGNELSKDWCLRIFKNTDYLRYRGLIHENITNINDETKLSYVFGSDDLAIYHTGYGLQIINSKLYRNLELIELEIKKYGRKPQHDMALADCYAGLKDYEKSLYHAQQALNSDVEAVVGRGNMYHKILNAMRALKYSDEDMLKVADEAVTNLPNLPEFYAERGMILCGLNRLDEAYISLHKSLEMWRNMPKDIHEESYFAGAVDVVYARLAEIEAFVGNFKEAMNNIKEAIKLNPRNKHYAKLASEYKMRL